MVQESNAVLLGAVGGPQWDNLPRNLRPESALLGIRKKLGLYCNIRPVKFYSILADKVVWKPEILEGVDLVILRELTGGAYFGKKEREGDKALILWNIVGRKLKGLLGMPLKWLKERKKFFIPLIKPMF